MTEAVFAIPGDINQPTGGYAYGRRVLALLPGQGLAVRHLQLPGGYPAPSAADLAATAGALAELPKDTVLIVDGLAYGAMPPEVIKHAACPIIALVHHPLCLETGLSDARQAELRASETAALTLARLVIATSATTASTLIDEFGVPAARMTVAEPGTDPAERARGSAGTLQLLAVGSIVPRKGYDVLVRALERVPAQLPWELTIAGDASRSPDTAAALKAQIAASAIAPRIKMAGALQEAALAQLYARSDVFVMSSLYEGYGMVLSEALARGLPIVTTTGGAAAKTVPDDAALKVEPGDVGALADALTQVIADADLRRRLGDAAWTLAQTSLTRWQDTAAIVARVIKELQA